MFAACGSVDCHVGLRPPRNDEGESAMTATPLSRALFFTPSIARFRRYRGDPRSLEDQRPPEGSNAAQGFFWRRRKPAQRREFGAKPDMLCVFSRPGTALRTSRCRLSRSAGTIAPVKSNRSTPTRTCLADAPAEFSRAVRSRPGGLATVKWSRPAFRYRLPIPTRLPRSMG